MTGKHRQGEAEKGQFHFTLSGDGVRRVVLFECDSGAKTAHGAAAFHGKAGDARKPGSQGKARAVPHNGCFRVVHGLAVQKRNIDAGD